MLAKCRASLKAAGWQNVSIRVITKMKRGTIKEIARSFGTSDLE
jgi:hypothetical protein